MSCINKQSKPTNLPKRKEAIAEMGEDAYAIVQSLTANDLLNLQSLHTDSDSGNLSFAFDLICRCLVDDTGNRIYETPEDARQFLCVSATTIEQLVNACCEVSGLSTEKKV